MWGSNLFGSSAGRGNQIDAQGWDSIIAAIDELPFLKSLNGYEEFYKLRCPSTQILDVSRSDLGGRELAFATAHHLSRMSSLTELDIR